jgi:NADH:ubiquinone reductase (H+-translocating)
MEVLIVGGGYIGMYTARRLERLLRLGEATVTVVDPRGYMTYQPFLAEAAGGSIEPRHVVAPLPQVLRRTRVLTGKVVSIDHGARSAVFAPERGPERVLRYDVLVMAAGSVSRVAPVEGLAEHGAGFKTVGEAVHLRNHVLGQLAAAASADDPAVRSTTLTFVVVGGGFAGVEALAELQGLADDAVRFYPVLREAELRRVLVEAAGRILPELDERLGRWTLRALRRRGVDVRLQTRLASAAQGTVWLDDGTELAAGTLVWAAGSRASPLGAAAGLPTDKTGRILVGADLVVTGMPGVFAAGDIAAVPDLSRPGEFCASDPVIRSGRAAGDVLYAGHRGRVVVDVFHKPGSAARPARLRDRHSAGQQAARSTTSASRRNNSLTRWLPNTALAADPPFPARLAREPPGRRAGAHGDARPTRRRTSSRTMPPAQAVRGRP